VAAFGEEPELPAPLTGRVALDSWRQVAALASSELASPWTTSVGRLFDAVSALCGVRTEVNYEGQAAIELEAICDAGERAAYPLEAVSGVLDARPTIGALMEDLASGTPLARVAARFHNALAQATAVACADRSDTVVLSGGVFQNRRLLESTAERLTATGVRVLIPERLPPNDGGVSYGQAAIAAARSK
jgi:hydrogenase maturation protein HypF